MSSPSLNGNISGCVCYGSLLAAPSPQKLRRVLCQLGISNLRQWPSLSSPTVQAAISGAVFGLGDLTAQAYEGRGVSQVDWLRTVRSSLVGVIAGPVGHFVYSSDGSLVDTTIDQLQVRTLIVHRSPSSPAAAVCPREPLSESTSALAPCPPLLHHKTILDCHRSWAICDGLAHNSRRVWMTGSGLSRRSRWTRRRSRWPGTRCTLGCWARCGWTLPPRLFRSCGPPASAS